MGYDDLIAASAAAKILAEKRASARVRAKFSASVFSEGEFLGHCIIEDVSEVGMRLELEAKMDLPDEFEVRTPAMPELVRVRVIWSKNKTMGVEFLADEQSGSADEAEKIAS